MSKRKNKVRVPKIIFNKDNEIIGFENMEFKKVENNNPNIKESWIGWGYDGRFKTIKFETDK